MHVVFIALRIYTIPFDALDEGDPLELLGSHWHGKARTAGPQPGEGRVTIDSVVSC